MPPPLPNKKIVSRVNKLREEIDHHRYLYHVLDKPVISDAALDSLKHELEQLEQQYPALVSPNSPTQRIGGQPLPEFKQVAHASPMLSLQDVFTPDELKLWDRRNQKIVLGDYQYFMERKIDGVAVALVYDEGRLQSGITRGDGRIGEDVTHNIRTIESIPLQLRGINPGRVEIRGEVYMEKQEFSVLNQKQKKQGKAPFANPRNASAGSLRQLDPRLAAARPLRFIAWEITAGLDLKTREQEYTALQDLGFPVPPGAKLYPSLDRLFPYLQQEDSRRNSYPFQVDGAVIKINDLALSRRLGIAGKAPRGSVAFKFAAEEAATQVNSIHVQIGRTGALTPVANLKPVTVAGTTVSRATLHNAGEITRKDVRVGDTVIIRKAGDIIPDIVSVLPHLRLANSVPFKFPVRCPRCQTPVHKEDGGAIYRCPNKACFPQQVERIIHAVSRQAFDIEGLGDKIVEQLIQVGLVKDAPDLWRLTAGDLLPLERFAAKSAANLIREITSRRKIELYRFLIALGIPQVGSITARDLAREFGSLPKITSASVARLRQVEGIGEKVAVDIHSCLNNSGTQKLIRSFLKNGIKIKSDRTAGPLSGQTFVFTGTLPNISREEAKNLVLQKGGKVSGSVGSNVTYVVVGEDAGSKARKAQSLGLKTLTPAQFKQMISK